MRTLMAVCHTRLVVFLLLFLTLKVMAVPVAWDNKEQQWLSQRSQNFEVFYLAGFEQMAQRSLDLAEQVHMELVPFFTDRKGRVSLPPEPTRMVLVDDFDFSNGWATPIPFAQIRLFASPPQDVNSLESGDDWLHGLIRHEYVHILHTEMARGLPHVGRYVFGRAPLLPVVVPLSLFPHALTPSMMLEGLAVYLETNKELGYGRLQSSFYQMLMRTEVASGDLESLGQVVVSGRRFPTNRAYLYGAFFIEFLVEKFGEQRLRSYLQNYSGQLIAFFMQQSTAQTLFGKTFTQLWNEYHVYLNQRFDLQIKQLSALESAQPGREVIAAAIPAMPVMAQHNQQILALRNNRQDRQALQWLSQADQPVLAREKGIGYIDVAQDGRVLVSRSLSYANGRIWNDLYLWQQQQGWQRLTWQQRYRKARWLNARQVLASRNVKGLSELVLLTLDKQMNIHSEQSVWQGIAGDVMGDFTLRNNQLVAAIKRPQQGWNLEMSFIHDNGQQLHWKKITNTRAVENSPELLADGRVIFSADYDDVFNIFILDPENGQLEQITHTLTGAFNPQLVTDKGKKQLFFARYEHDGYQVVKQDIPRVVSYSETRNISDYDGRYNYPQPVQHNKQQNYRQPQDYTVTSSAFWRSFRPHTWLPVASSNSDESRLGALTAGTDALGRHRYSAMVNYDSKQEEVNGLLTYQYDNRWLLAFNRNHKTLSSSRIENGRVIDNIQREDTWLLQRSWLWPQFEDTFATHLGLISEHKTIVDLPLSRDESLVGAALTFNNRESFIDVPGVGWGSYIDLIAETNDVLESDYEGNIFQARLAHTFDLPGRFSLTYDVAGGWADSGAESFVLGSESGEENLLFGRNEYRLRGYDSGVQEGHKIYRQTASIGFPIARVDNNWGLNPFGLADISGNVFVDNGKAWFRKQNRDELTGVGIEVVTEVVLGYRALLPVKIGYAKGLDKANGSREHVYMSFGFSL